MSPAHVAMRGRVLVADDDPSHRDLLATALRAQGFDVVETSDGQDLLAQLLAVPSEYFTCVVADQMMPQLRGTEVLARASARAPFVIVTGHADPAIDQAAAQFGAVAVVRKPVDVGRLIVLIDDARAKRRSGIYPAITPPKSKK